MKKLTLLSAVAFLLYGTTAFGQGGFPTNNSIIPPQFLGFNGTGVGGAKDLDIRNNYNRPIKMFTNSINRAHINPNRTQTILGYTFNANGYMGLGENSVAPAHPNGVWNDFGPFSILHLNGSGTEVRPSGFRPWMQTGITLTDNHDLSYFGLRKVDTGLEKTETVIAWSDNPLAPSGPDDMVFRFFYPGNGNTNISNSLNSPGDMDGRHIARFTGNGAMGLGATFGDPSVLAAYVRPASLLHMSVIEHHDAWLQITQQMGTGETANDGLRMGISVGGPINSGLSYGYLRWQEITPFIIQTDWNTSSGGLGTGNGERLRISSINALGVPHPVGIPNNTTRISISHSGNNEVSEPRSLLHMGYNTSASGDGWRDWMDVGTFLNNGSDNMYVGLKKQKSGGTNDRYDAVVNWGDNQTSTPGVGPDNLLFIFTSTIGTDNPPANSNNGLEVARMIPGLASTLSAPNYGMMGIGDWTTAFNTLPANVIDAKLDIDGDLRIRTVTEDTTLLQVLVIDSTDHNRVHWRNVDDLGTDDQNLTLLNGILSIEDGNSVDLSSLDTDTDQQTLSFNGSGELCISGGNCVPLPPGGGGTVTAQNGLNTNISGTGAVELGGSLLHNTTVNMNGKNLELSTNSHGNISLGDNPTILGSASLNRNIAMGRGNLMSDALQSFTYGLNNEISGGSIYSAQHGNHAFGFENKIVGGAKNIAIGSRNEIKNTSLINGPTPSDCFLFGYYNVARNTGNVLVGRFVPSPYNGLVSIGNANELRRNIVLNYADNGGSFNTAHIDPTVLSSQAIPAINIDQFNRIGVGKYAPSCALDVVGSICASGSITAMSDSTMKTNINPLTNTLDLINQLRPISYEWINKTDTFMYGTQYGFTAQQVETVIPDLVHLGLDGKKVLNYTGLFAFLTQGIKEQQKTIDSMETTIQQQDSINTNLETRLSYLENCIAKANICEEGNRTMNTEPSNTTNYKSIELTNVNSIILDQNLPNPFAEHTVINYNIPTEVSEVKLLFYDLNGRIIKELVIEERGESKLTVYGTNLKTGVYTYSLIADGELIATKKMVKK